MSAISTVGKIQKAKTETFLQTISEKNSDIEIDYGRINNTPIRKCGDLALDIYYRKSEVRINIRMHSPEMQKYKLLSEQGIAYQKDTANPYSTKGMLAFFVNERDVPHAICCILNLEKV